MTHLLFWMLLPSAQDPSHRIGHHTTGVNTDQPFPVNPRAKSTLDDSFIILDEAQNTTPEQMKMFLTRLGFGSKTRAPTLLPSAQDPSHRIGHHTTGVNTDQPFPVNPYFG
jgi:hypothetical protein